METWEAIRSRRNVRTYEDRPIEEADLTRILEAARRAPSSKNEQRWDFVVVEDRQRLEDLARVWQGARHVPGSAVTIALIAPVTDDQRVRESIAYDLGQVTMSVMLAAADLGIGSGHSSVRDQEAAREILLFPETHYCAWLIAMGYPADRALEPVVNPARRPLEEVVHWETW